MRSVPIRRLKSELKTIIDGVQGGESVLITRDGAAVALLLPIDHAKLEKFLTKQAPPVVSG